MTVAKAEPSIRTDDGTLYIFEDENLYEALVAATRRVLDQYDDGALLSQRQARIVVKARRAVLDELGREEPARLAMHNRWHFSRALGAYILRETRKRQGWAFERRLAEEYGPLGPIDAAEIDRRITVVNGVRVFAVDPPSSAEEAGRA
jgi:hypothetical protein